MKIPAQSAIDAATAAQRNFGKCTVQHLESIACSNSNLFKRVSAVPICKTNKWATSIAVGVSGTIRCTQKQMARAVKTTDNFHYMVQTQI
jgi:hypothetical protein